MAEDDFNSLNNILKKFDDPFLLYSDAYFPANTTSALEMCRYLWYLCPKYRKASQRVARHFITDFDFPGEGDATEKEEFREFIQYQLRLKNTLIEAGDDERCYGNVFFRIHYPFDRFLEDRRSGSLVRYALSDFSPEDVKYHWKEMLYEVPDPKFKNPKENGKDKAGKIPTVKLQFIDRRNKDKERIKVRKIDPRHVSLFYSNINGEFQVLYRFPPYLDQMIKNNDLFQINRMPKDMLEAFSLGYDFLFHHNEVFHLKTPTISGISEYGWGLPEPIANFRDIHQYQIYRKADEAVGMDYVLPFRVISPEAGTSISDSLANVVMAKFTASVKTMIEQRRKDKTSIHGFPMPINYQEFGGNAKQFSQKDLMEYHGNALLQAAGYPVELFDSSLQVQQIPTTIRLFENGFWHLYDGYNALISWAVERITTYLGMEAYDIVLQRPDLADNIDKQNMLIQLGMNGELPRKAYMRYFNVSDPVTAQIDRMDEDMQIEMKRQEKQVEYQKMQQNSINAEAASNGEGNGQGDDQGSGTTPGDVEEQAQGKAEEWMQLPIGERRKAMDAMKAQNFNLYSLAKEIMNQKRGQGAAEGRAQANQQAQQGGGGGQ